MPLKYLEAGSKLNLASRNAAATTKIDAGTYFHMLSKGDIKIYKYAGATPKLTKSDKESSSLPISDDTLSILATKPSKASKNKEQRMKMEPIRISSHKIAKNPQRRLKEVNIDGTNFFTLVLNIYWLNLPK